MTCAQGGGTTSKSWGLAFCGRSFWSQEVFQLLSLDRASDPVSLFQKHPLRLWGEQLLSETRHWQAGTELRGLEAGRSDFLVCGPSPPLQGTRGHEVPQRGCSGLEAWPGSVTDLRQAPVWAPPVKGRVRERVCGHDHELLGVKSRAWVPRLSFSPSGPAWLLGQCQ